MTEYTDANLGGDEAGSVESPYWFDARPLTEKPEKIVGAPDSAGGRFRKAWSGGSLKDRLDAVRTVDVKGMAADWWSDAVNAGKSLERFAESNGLSYRAPPIERAQGAPC